jgi:hypothetical protein
MRIIENHESQVPDSLVTLSEDNYQQIPNILVKDVRKQKIAPLDVVVWIVFAHHQRQKSRTWPSNKTV